MEVAPPLRVLCLHGFRTNARVMEGQLRGLRSALPADTQFAFLNAPFEAQGPTDPSIQARFGGPFHEWWRIQDVQGVDMAMNDAESSVRAYENADISSNWYMRYGGLEQSIALVDAHLREHGPYDVVVGFSQGAVLLTILTMWYLRREGRRWWKMAICTCGVRVSAVNIRELFLDADGSELIVPLPSVHILGRQDPLYSHSLELVGMYESSANVKRLVLEHDGGHKFPSGKTSRVFYEDLAAVIHEQCRGVSAVSVLETVGHRQSKL